MLLGLWVVVLGLRVLVAGLGVVVMGVNGVEGFPLSFRSLRVKPF